MILLLSGCTNMDYRDSRAARDYEKQWADPCAWEKAGRLARVIRVGELELAEDPIDTKNFPALVAAREQERCRHAR